MIEEIFPAYGDYIAYVWRQKQLEYSWLRTTMGFYEDFAVVTRDAPSYALTTLAIVPDNGVVDAGFDRLAPFADMGETLTGLAPYRLAILNGSPAMLSALLEHSEFANHFE